MDFEMIVLDELTEVLLVHVFEILLILIISFAVLRFIRYLTTRIQESVDDGDPHIWVLEGKGVPDNTGKGLYKCDIA